jgi:hypothetical protein
MCCIEEQDVSSAVGFDQPATSGYNSNLVFNYLSICKVKQLNILTRQLGMYVWWSSKLVDSRLVVLLSLLWRTQYLSNQVQNQTVAAAAWAVTIVPVGFFSVSRSVG